jgi:hypothetical protein
MRACTAGSDPCCGVQHPAAGRLPLIIAIIVASCVSRHDAYLESHISDCCDARTYSSGHYRLFFAKLRHLLEQISTVCPV